MEYKSVIESIEDFWDKSWCDLPVKQREAWYLAAYLNSHQRSVGPCMAGTPEMGALFKWDEWGAERRKSIAAQHDQLHDPANEEENSFWFNNASDISDVEREIREIEFMPTPLPSERAEKNRLQADARQRLADLKSAKFQPSTVKAASSGAPEPAPKVSSETAEPTTWQENTCTIADEPEIRKRAALIAEFKGIWPSIERDLRDASRTTSGLAKAAKHPTRPTFWVVEPALAWAKQRGKITKDSAQKFIKTNNESVFAVMLSQIFNI